MRQLVFAAAAATGLLYATSAMAGTCGPFGMFKGNDYCVNCQSGNKKVYNCPGGEVGQVVVGTQHPGCQISFFDPSTCPGVAAALVTTADAAVVAPVAEQPQNHASPGTAILSREGDEIIIRMTEEDFKKLMTLKEK